MQRRKLSWLPVIGFGLLAIPSGAQLVPLYTVNTTSDSATVFACVNNTAGCSLRGAIQAANSVSNSVIRIAIPSSDPFCSAGVCTINVGSALPTITSPVEIDGPGADKLTVRPATGVAIRNFNVTATGVVTFFGLTISSGSNGSTGGNGGGILSSSSGTVNVIECALNNNSTGSSGNGGGIFNSASGTLNVTRSTLTGNSCVTAGGGIGNDGILNVSNTTFSGHFGSTGGGILNKGTAKITNSTFSGNQATSAGAIANQGGTVDLTNSTISGNSVSAGPGGGLYNSIGTFNVKSCLIALNTSSSPNVGVDAEGNFVSAGFNLIGKKDKSAGFTAATDQTGTVASPLDPKLDPGGLQNNGGPTKTIALLFGSPAIDKGTSLGLTGNLTTDQRASGFPRTFNDPSVQNANGGDDTDIGAFEVQVAPPTPTPTPTATATPIGTPSATPTATPVTTLANISTRLRVETGDNVLIGGFIITGTQPKKVIVRGIGTSLPLADKLANPTLELHGPNGLIEANDNWVDSPNKQAIIDSTIPPSSELESAIVATLPANGTGYTAIVRGVNNGTGIGVVEAYDLNTAVDSRLANISTRGFVQTGDNVLIAGTIVVGQVPQKVIIRAIGPSLSLPGKLEDPTLELHDGNGVTLESNDNWVDSPNKQAIIDSTVPPTNDLESAIVRTLPANGANYTAIVRGVNDATGVAVVEVYALP